MSKLAKNIVNLFLLSAAVLAATAPTAQAQDQAATLQRIIERLKRLEQENAELRREVYSDRVRLRLKQPSLPLLPRTALS